MRGKTKSTCLLILLLTLLYNQGEAAAIDRWRERAQQKYSTQINPYTGEPRGEKKRVYIYKEKPCPECTSPTVPQNVTVVEETPIKVWYDECVYCPTPKGD